MIFSDPGGAVVLKFKRLSPESTFSIAGNWMIDTLFSTRVSQLVQFDYTAVTFCQRKVVADY